jgi:hypothetical protein
VTPEIAQADRSKLSADSASAGGSDQTALSRLKNELTWLAGGLAAITGALYALGFMAIQAHLNLLGVARLVEVQNRDYLVSGAEFVLFLPIYLAIGLIPWVIMSSLLRRLDAAVASGKQWPIAVLFVVLWVALGVWVLWLTPPLGLLLEGATTSKGPLHGLILEGEHGRAGLQIGYCAYVGSVAVFAAFGKSLARTTLCATWARVLRMGYFAGLFIGLALVPIGFGFYVIPIKYPRATIQTKQTAAETIVGWVLNRNLGGEDKSLVVYPSPTKNSGASTILVLSNSSYEKIIINKFDFIFSVDPSDSRKD